MTDNITGTNSIKILWSKQHTYCENWHKWNIFVPSVEILKQPSGHNGSANKLEVGTDMRFNMYMTPGDSATSSLERVTVLDSEAGKICWQFTGAPS